MNNIKLIDSINFWLEQKENSPNSTEGTLRNYTAYTNNHLLPYFNDTYISNINEITIQAFFKKKTKDGLSVKTLRNIKSFMNIFFSQQVQSGIIVINPITDSCLEMNKKKKTSDKPIKKSPKSYKPIRAKKDNGTGSIRQRKDGRFEGRYYYEDKRFSIYASTQEEARNILNMVLVSLKDGSYVGKNKETFAGYLVNWIEDYSKTAVIEPATRTSYLGYVRSHIVPWFGKTRIQKIETSHIQEFFNEKRISGRADGKKGGLSDKTLLNMKNFLHLAFSYAVEDKIVKANPISRIVLDAAETVEIEMLQKREVDILIDKLLNYKGNQTIAMAIIMLVNTGLRRGELLGLKWLDVDFNRNTITVRHSLRRIEHPNKYQAKNYTLVSEPHTKQNNTGVYLSPPKTKNSKRTVPLGVKSLNALLGLKNIQEVIVQNNTMNSFDYNKWGFVVCDDFGMYYDPDTFAKHFKRVLKEIEVPEIRLHATRHTFATMAVENNPHDIASVSEILGHADISTTLKYTHAFDNKKVSVMSNF